MAYSITAGNVVPQAGATTRNVIAGQTITAGMPVRNNGSGVWVKASSASDDAADGGCGGIALTNSSLNQPMVICTEGDIAFGALFNRGASVCGGESAGTLEDYGSLVADNYVTHLGFAISSTVLRLSINASGVTLDLS